MLEIITATAGGGAALIWGPRLLVTVLACVAACRKKTRTYNRLVEILEILCRRQTPKQ